VKDGKPYTIAVQGYHVKNSAAYLNVTNDELVQLGEQRLSPPRLAMSLEEYLRQSSGSVQPDRRTTQLQVTLLSPAGSLARRDLGPKASFGCLPDGHLL